jgi:outer membrane receptor protein involved in Fe transport
LSARWAGPLALLVATAALADDVADEAEFHFKRGLAAQQRGRVEEALAEFYASNRLVQNRNVQLNIASALGRLGSFDEAFRAYSELERQSVSAEEQADIDRALAFLRPKLALVRVDSSPPGAAIFVERRDLGALGTTPKTLALPPGKAKVLFELEGFRPAEVSVVLVKGKQVEATLELERIFGTLEFTSIPLGAAVRLEGASGEVLMAGPGKLRLVPGRVSLYVEAQGFLPARLDVDVPADATRTLDLKLSPEPPPPPSVGALVVRSNLDGALVRVDGKEMGFTPVVIEGVEAGLRVVEVSREGREPETEEVDLQDHERRFMDVVLRPRRVVVAGATQKTIRLEDAPASMTVITADEIRAFGYLTVADALRSVRGLHVFSDRAYDSVGVRGFGVPENANARVLVLVNGHPVNDLIRGYGPIGSELGIDLNQVERIEVVRGGGMVFGATAYLGLVNVVMREPEVGLHAEVGVGGQSLGGVDGRAAASAKNNFGEVLVLMGGGAGRGSPLPSLTGFAKDDEKSGDVHVFARAGRFSLTAGTAGRQKQVPVQYAWARSDTATLGDGRSFAALQWDHTFEGGSFFLARAALDSSSFSIDSHPPGPDWQTETGQANGVSGEVRFEWAVSAAHRLTFGASGQLSGKLAMHAATSDGGEPFDYRKQGGLFTLYVSDEWVPREAFRLHVGLRVDPVQVATQQVEQLDKGVVLFMPHLALLGRPYEGGNTKLLAGITARGPSTYERGFGAEGFQREAPSELKQEDRFAVELEHSHALNDETTVTGTAFLNVYSGIITSVPVEEGSSVQRLVNSPTPMGAAGGELEVRYAPGDGKLATIAGVFQGSTTAGGSELPNFPAHVVSARFLWPVLGPALRASTELVLVGRRNDRYGRRVDGTMYWNVMLSGEHVPWRLTYYGGVFDLLDERRPEPVGPDFLPATAARFGREVRVGCARRF